MVLSSGEGAALGDEPIEHVHRVRMGRHQAGDEVSVLCHSERLAALHP